MQILITEQDAAEGIKYLLVFSTKIFLLTRKRTKGMYIDQWVDGNMLMQSHDKPVDPPGQVPV